ncbi:MAG: hypothetical protein ACR2MK_08145 [Solirubrobacteraceae bacterium]
MADWVTISSLATAGGTLVLAVATFSSVRSANRSARLAELSLMAGLRPVLIPSREEDPTERIRFGDQQLVMFPATAARSTSATRRSTWRSVCATGAPAWPSSPAGACSCAQALLTSAPSSTTHRQQIDLYIPAGDTGYWLGALRGPSAPAFDAISRAAAADELVQVDLLYGDHEGGQRTIVRFVMSPWPEGEAEGKRAYALRYWNVDREDPR